MMTHLPWCVKDSDTFRREVIEIRVPPNAKLVTFDAQAMYSNICLDHAMQVMKHWLEHVYRAPITRPLNQAILQGLELVMRHNIMKFGDSYFLQLIGTAMGTSVAVVFANLYFGWHEKVTLLPKYRDALKRILFHARFIDDVFFIWTGDMDSTWESLIQDYNNYGILKWDITSPKTAVNFLDLTITIENDRLTTKTFQKPNNPYLYIPPHSAHTPGMIHGIIFSLLRTYYCQNSKYSDFVHFSSLLFKRHVMQGWDPAVLKDIFASAIKKLLKPNQVPHPNTTGPASSQDHRGQLFYHMEFHPGDIPRQQVRQIYSRECETTFKAEIGIERFTLAYSRPKTIGNIVAKASLFQTKGREVSKFITGELN
eukprot:CCRYP_006649-RB/>CCRYP_006649-RB protein AED:0.21 eAED:0.04 QI:0/-1/0/1/-1/0/1/0/367